MLELLSMDAHYNSKRNQFRNGADDEAPIYFLLYKSKPALSDERN